MKSQPGWVFFAALFFVMPLWVSAAENKQVLVLYDERIELPGLSAIDASIAANFNETEYTVDLFREEMDLSRLRTDDYLDTFANFLTNKYREQELDVIIAVMGPVLDFLLERREILFTDIPIVFLGVDSRELLDRELPANVTGVLLERKFSPTLELVLDLHPQTNRVFFIAGSSNFDRRLQSIAERELTRFQNRVQIEYLNNLAMPQLLQTVAQLPDNSLVLYGTLFRDGNGDSFVSHEVAAQISAAANAPVYGFLDQLIGYGIVGGHLYSMAVQGREAVNLTARVLAGDSPAEVPVATTAAPRPMFDYQQLRRWNIPVNALPPDSQIQFQPQTLWRQHPEWVVAAITVVLLQSFLIGLLLFQRRRIRRNKAQLWESESRFRAMADNTPVMVWVADAEGKSEFFNQAWLDFTGRKQEEELKRKLGASVHLSDFQSYVNTVNRAFDKRAAYQSEYRLRRHDGEYRWILEKGVPRYADDNTCTGFIVSALDISDRREQELALRASQDRYRQLIETQTDLICRYTPDSTLTFVNQAYCRFFNKTREELIGHKFINLIPDEAHPVVRRQIAAVIDNRGPTNWEHEVLLPNGEIGWQHWIDQPIMDADGRVGEIQAIGRDITDRKRAETAQQNLSHALRLAVAGELTAMVAHEVSQPLGAIMANTEAAQMLLELEDPPLDEIKAILVDIRDSDALADQAIRRMRELLRKREIKLQPLDINEVVHTAYDLVSGDAIQRNVRIKKELAERVPLVLGDQVHLQQVLLNLLVNAMDAMHEVDVVHRKLCVQTHIRGEAVVVSVVDSGPGVKPGKSGKLFESFYSTKKDGMGLGLAICRSIVESHRGKIWADNHPDGGAVFSFSLNVMEAVEQTPKQIFTGKIKEVEI